MARVLSLSRCPSLSARVELSRAPLTLEHVKIPRTRLLLPPGTGYSLFQAFYSTMRVSSSTSPLSCSVRPITSTLILSTKRLSPIIGNVDHGTFTPSYTNSNLTLLFGSSVAYILRLRLRKITAHTFLSVHADTVDYHVRQHCTT